ncbi:MAG TPA: DUF5916 domain-containing protein, partial [Kofleriaceae bacterium]|nr:DUF5916 domain-containing protein [Kofleriaceae bacterium]
RDERGWTAEFRIPFSQLAFNLPAGAASLTWGINFYRYSPAHRESSNWSPRYRGLRGIVSNFNDIVVPAPSRVVRFEATPYVAPRWGDDPAGRRGLSLRAGADLRVGLGSSVNLTATALPDFGQVEADPSQVNLSAFELFQPERRPFFLEGLDLFRMGTGLVFTSRDLSFADEAPFYSRRVGRPPRGEAPPGAVLESVPGETTLLGAGKLTGQTGSGWTLGVFSAVTDGEDAAVRLEDGREVSAPVEARAATTVARATRSLGGGDSSIGLLAADLHRFGLSGPLAGQVVGDAAALGGEVQHRLGERRYEVRGWLLGSRLSGDRAAIARVAESPTHYLQRPDGPGRGEPTGDSLSGIAGETRLSRVDGAFTWDLVGRAVSPGFDMNEIGFQRASDWLLAAAAWKLEWFRPESPIRAWTIGSTNLGAGWTWDGEARTRVADAYVSADTRTSWTIKLAARHEATTLSTDRLRGGPAVLLPPRSGASISLVTDQNRASFASLDASAEREPGSRSWSVAASPSATVRIADPAWVSISPSYRVDAVGWQLLTSAGQGEGDDTDWIVGRVRQRTLAVALRADLVFTPRLVLQAYVQPFATVGRFDGFQRLVDGRARTAGRRFERLRRAQIARDPEAATLGFDVNGDGAIDASLADPDGEERAFNASLVVRWEVAPGSTITAAATQERGGAASGAGRAPLGALGRLADDAPRDVLLVKLCWRLGT